MAIRAAAFPTSTRGPVPPFGGGCGSAGPGHCAPVTAMGPAAPRSGQVTVRASAMLTKTRS